MVTHAVPPFSSLMPTLPSLTHATSSPPLTVLMVDLPPSFLISIDQGLGVHFPATT